MAVIRYLALGLLCGLFGVFGAPRGEGFEHARLSAIMGMELVQLLTVPLGLVIGLIVAVTRRGRPPGRPLAAVMIAFGVVLFTQAGATGAWVDTDPPGIGDPDGEAVVAMLGRLEGLFAVFVGLVVLVVRWAPAVLGAPRRRSRGAPARAGDA
ncbi:hypothetical protein MF672_011185 [Actinomadura sp. ATCC 31491]|uniref:Uncharacterized protein n=1 Tax=Actinomadura luzonensis TaxID=2805427 RepID=A0ABT0FQQ4_9ACTN|nr:hypothetical protein [Actinomadura luzonensis]MCK2214350.1 hypothetical protein [Actinomadura luzonensis]